MGKPLRVLIIEDSEEDSALVINQLRQGGYDPMVEQVTTPGAMTTALRNQTWDLVITDWSMQQFSALDAIDLLKSEELDLPVIIVSGTIGEETAVAAMKAGPHDYLTKSNLSRLVPAIERELQQARGRREHKRTGESLRQSEARMRAVLDSALDAVVGMDAHGNITYWNPRSETIFGWTRGEALGRSMAETIIPPKHRDAHNRGLQHFLATGEGPILNRRIEITALRRDGTEFPVELTVSPLKVGDSFRFNAFIADITERKQAEAQLKNSFDLLRTLSRHLEVIREEERGRIAREIHDELGVVLTCLKLDLSRLHDFVSDGDKPTVRQLAQGKIKSMIQLIDSTIAMVQRIATELRPIVLDDLGLVAAIEWQAQDFQNRTGIICTFRSTTEDIELEREKATAMFRICQEALTNVARHAHATSVVICLEELTDYFKLEVKDNGWGIAEQKISDSQSLGLLGMRERAISFGGEISITGRAGEGTAIALRIPRQQSI